MSENLPLIMIGAGLLLLVLWLWMRRRAAARAARRAQPRPGAGDEAVPVVPPPATWAPPRYEAARDAKAGPSLRVAINIVQVSDAGLLVSWNATNDGSPPVAVQWGAPAVVVEQDLLQLRYTQEPGAPFAPPEVRTCQPGEILSRSATVAREAAGQALGGMRVTVAVGYGSANEHDDACTDQGAYLAWQRIAVSPPRIVPRG